MSARVVLDWSSIMIGVEHVDVSDHRFVQSVWEIALGPMHIVVEHSYRREVTT